MQASGLDEYQHMDMLEKTHPQISKNQWRWIAANKDRYGISHAIKRVGRRLYFHVPSLIKWIEEQEA